MLANWCPAQKHTANVIRNQCRIRLERMKSGRSGRAGKIRCFAKAIYRRNRHKFYAWRTPDFSTDASETVPLHERTQKALARLTFVLCCAVPTLLLMLIIVVGKTPWYHRRCIDAIEHEVAQQTGLVTQIGQYEMVSPGHTLLKQIQLTDPETGATVATVRQIDWSIQDGRTHVLLQQPELHADTLNQTWDLLHDRFLCRPQHLTGSARVAATDLTIHSRLSPITLRDVDAWIGPDVNSAGLASPSQSSSGVSPSNVRATIECLMASPGGSGLSPGGGLSASAATSPIQITVLRDRSGPAPTTHWSLATGSTALPCSAIAEYLPGHWSNLGTEAMFSGSVAGVTSTHDWKIDLSGASFSNLSLDYIFANQPHRLSGTASIKLERCRLHPNQQLVDVSGSIHATHGLIASSLLEGAAQHLGFLVADLPPDAADVPYDCMAMRFSLNGPRMHVSGTCRHQHGYASLPTGVALCVGGMPLAQAPGSDLPAIRLMSVLAPVHSEMVPLAQQNQGLLQLLLPPRRVMPDVQNQPPPAPRISGLETYQGGPLTLERR